MTYFLKQFGWADLLASMPFPQLKILRLFRVIRVWRLLNELGPKGIVDEFVSNRARSALLTLLLFVILLIEFGSLTILSVERYNPDAPIQTASDAVWYTFVTITTVGYGDMYPVTQLGRMIGIVIMAVGVGLFGTLTGYLSHLFLGSTNIEEDEAAIPRQLEADSMPNGTTQTTSADLDETTSLTSQS